MAILPRLWGFAPLLVHVLLLCGPAPVAAAGQVAFSYPSGGETFAKGQTVNVVYEQSAWPTSTLETVCGADTSDPQRLKTQDAPLSGKASVALTDFTAAVATTKCFFRIVSGLNASWFVNSGVWTLDLTASSASSSSSSSSGTTTPTTPLPSSSSATAGAQSSSSTTAAPEAAAGGSSSSSSSSSTSSSSSSPSGMVSVGTAAGIGVGVGVAVVAIGALALACLWKRKMQPRLEEAAAIIAAHAGGGGGGGSTSSPEIKQQGGDAGTFSEYMYYSSASPQHKSPATTTAVVAAMGADAPSSSTSPVQQQQQPFAATAAAVPTSRGGGAPVDNLQWSAQQGGYYHELPMGNGPPVEMWSPGSTDASTKYQHCPVPNIPPKTPY